jgi:hypothetical protein
MWEKQVGAALTHIGVGKTGCCGLELSSQQDVWMCHRVNNTYRGRRNASAS